MRRPSRCRFLLPNSRGYFDDPERLERLTRAKSPDRQKWGASSSYRPDWAARGVLAAGYVRDGARVLEIGAGPGTFRQLVAGRCHYTGADLQPLDPDILALDISIDPIPSGTWDVIVMLGVLEYLYNPHAVLRKVAAATQRLVVSYCIPSGADPQPRRRARGWTNALCEQDLTNTAATAGLLLKTSEDFNETEDFRQKLLVFDR